MTELSLGLVTWESCGLSIVLRGSVRGMLFAGLSVLVLLVFGHAEFRYCGRRRRFPIDEEVWGRVALCWDPERIWRAEKTGQSFPLRSTPASAEQTYSSL